jgi:hypothetical protein
MALSDRTAKNLARGPAVLFPADPADAMSEALLRRDPALKIKNDKFVFRNGALICALHRSEDLLRLH